MIGQLYIAKPALSENLAKLELFSKSMGRSDLTEDSRPFGLFLIGDIFVGRG